MFVARDDAATSADVTEDEPVVMMCATSRLMPPKRPAVESKVVAKDTPQKATVIVDTVPGAVDTVPGVVDTVPGATAVVAGPAPSRKTEALNVLTGALSRVVSGGASGAAGGVVATGSKAIAVASKPLAKGTTDEHTQFRFKDL